LIWYMITGARGHKSNAFVRLAHARNYRMPFGSFVCLRRFGKRHSVQTKRGVFTCAPAKPTAEDRAFEFDTYRRSDPSRVRETKEACRAHPIMTYLLSLGGDAGKTKGHSCSGFSFNTKRLHCSNASRASALRLL
jgi:hypothetical protein